MSQIDNPAVFFNIQRHFSSIPFTQAEGWFLYQHIKNKSIVFFVDNLKDAKIACWGREYKIPLIKKKILQIEGECFESNIDEKEIKTFFSELTKLSYTGIEVNSNNKYIIDYEIGIRRAGYLRPVISYSCPLTIEIDLTESFNFDRNWRRNVKKAIGSQLAFFELKNSNPFMIERITQIFKEMSDLKKLRYSLEPESLERLISSADIRTFIVENQEGRIISARVIHEHKGVLSDVFAANSNEARECGAAYFLMDSLLHLFKEEKKVKFDFGRIPPSNSETDSVYLFKNGTRGEKVQYNGEWVFYKKRWMEFMMVFYKFFVLKKQRY